MATTESTADSKLESKFPWSRERRSTKPLSETELQRMEHVAANTEGDLGFQFQHTQHFAVLVDEYRKLKEDVKRWKEMHAQAKGKKP